MPKLWDQFEADAERIARIKAVATWEPYGGTMVVMPFGGTDLWTSKDDPGVIATGALRWFALSPLKGELRYFAGENANGEDIDFELGMFGAVGDALALAEAYLVHGKELRDIETPRQVMLAELPAKPNAVIPRPKLRYREPPPPPLPFMRKWFPWVFAAPRVLSAPFRRFFGGYNGCLTIPMMAVFIVPCILVVRSFVSGTGIWWWIKTLAIGVGAAVALTMTGVFAFGMHAMWKHTRKPKGIRGDDGDLSIH
jgi:hypothetical protein